MKNETIQLLQNAMELMLQERPIPYDAVQKLISILEAVAPKKNPMAMNALVAFVTARFNADEPKVADLHHTICQETADEFSLWEEIPIEGVAKASEQRFPLWLSYVVQGIGRDLGKLD